MLGFFPRMMRPVPLATTWNPLDREAGVSLTNGDLTAQAAATSYHNVRSTSAKSQGRWKAEITAVSPVAGSSLGLATASASLTTPGGSTAQSITWHTDGSVQFNGSVLGTVDAYANGHVLSFELDRDTGELWLNRSGGTGRKGPFPVPAGVLFMFASCGTGAGGTLNALVPFTIPLTSGFVPWGEY